MNNEPVAYFVKDKHGWWAETDKETGIPLYTHPAELTDEEIWEIAQPYGDLSWQDCTLDFARAILRKAQEK